MKNAHVVDTNAAVPGRGFTSGPGAGQWAPDPARRTVPVLAPVFETTASHRISGGGCKGELARPGRRWRTEPTSMARAVATRLAAGLVAALISFGLLGSVAWLFQRDGAPLEQVAAAEHACADRAYASERDACMLAESRHGARARPVPACAAAPPGDLRRMEC